MDIGIISSRYARALLEFACEREAETTVYQQTEIFLKRYAQKYLKSLKAVPLLS